MYASIRSWSRELSRALDPGKSFDNEWQANYMKPEATTVMSSQSSASLPPKQDRKLKAAERGDWLVIAVPDVNIPYPIPIIANRTGLIFMILTSITIR